jgi:hypothetical protein
MWFGLSNTPASVIKMEQNKNVLEMAFRKPYASDVCEVLGKLFAKDNAGYDIRALKELTEADEGAIWLAIDRLKNEYRVLETFPEFPKEKPAPGAEVRVPYKFRVKPQYQRTLKELFA